MRALEAYQRDTGQFPTTGQGLQALREEIEGVRNWNGPYLGRPVPTDPWNDPYVYKYPGDHGDKPDIMSTSDHGTQIASWERK